MSDVTTELLDGGVFLITFNRPDQMNSIGGDILPEFGAAMRHASDDRAVRAVVITGAGRAFCAGADLSAMGEREAGAAKPTGGSRVWDGEYRIRSFHADWAGALYSCPKPTIALVNGAAAGAGMGLALSADFRIAAESALFVSAFPRIALSGDSGISYGLSRLVGRSKALEILMLSPRITGAEAAELGLAREVVPDDKLMEVGLEFAGRLAKGPLATYARMKQNLAYAEIHSHRDVLDMEGTGIGISFTAEEQQQAVRAFLEKRDPEFT